LVVSIWLGCRAAYRGMSSRKNELYCWCCGFCDKALSSGSEHGRPKAVVVCEAHLCFRRAILPRSYPSNTIASNILVSHHKNSSRTGVNSAHNYPRVPRIKSDACHEYNLHYFGDPSSRRL
jgi:hypothetical protein